MEGLMTPDGISGKGATASVNSAMAVAAGIAVANIYYNQPLLGIIEHAFPGQGRVTALVPTATQIGYAAGLFLLVPLGDLMDRRRLIVGQFIVLAVALALAALAPTAGLLLVASLLLGACATVAQQVVPFAAILALPGKAGAAVGTVMAGVLCGILFSRTLAGFVGAHAGWREMFWLGVPLALIASGFMAALLPHHASNSDLRYGAALRSVINLWRSESRLRRATMVQAALFGSFTTFWTVLALQLQGPAFRLDASIAGLFGLVGAVGVLAAPVAGRIADRRGPALVVGIGAGSTVLAWLCFALLPGLTGLVVGVIVLDFGVQAALVSNQHMVFALRPEARSRLNTVFMTGMFAGGATGSALATLAWAQAGWAGVCAIGSILALLAVVLETVGRRQLARMPQTSSAP